MTKVIQQVHLNSNPNNDLFIIGFDIENEILRYKTTTSGTREISEKIRIEDGKVVLSDMWFSVDYLTKFLIENELIETPTE